MMLDSTKEVIIMNEDKMKYIISQLIKNANEALEESPEDDFFKEFGNKYSKKEIIFPKSNKIHTLVITNIYFFSLFIIMITNSCLLLFGFIIQLFCYINKNTKLIE